ncbi:hypothetical protein, partial [Cyanobium sp. FACHB-13342]|uniref:hypothetical protein n=1 Tax=Cyanobium sp. FACHB-13342 TaxID=2692793 RepID=UPI0018F0495D
MAASANAKSKGSAWLWQNLDATSEQAGDRVPYEVLQRTTSPEAPPNPTVPRVDALTGLALAQTKANSDLSTAFEATSKTTPVIPSRPEKGSGNEGKGAAATPEAPVLAAVAAEQARQAIAKETAPDELIGEDTPSVVLLNEPSAPENWASTLESWHILLQKWSQDGSLEAAAREALMLDGPNAKPQSEEILQSFISNWSVGRFENLPEIVFLSKEAMHGAMGAYAISTGKMYINTDWANQASPEQIHAVLTEEQGHHLDAQLNFVDMTGDEGDYFYRVLIDQIPTDAQKQALRNGNDSGFAIMGGTLIAVEQASANSSIPGALSAGGTSTDQSCSITALSDGSSLITGTFYGAITFGSTTLTAPSENSSAFVAKLNADGSFAWATQATGGYVASNNCATALSDGSSLITGNFWGAATTFGGTTLTAALNSDIFVAKLNADGSFAWATQTTGGFLPESGGVTALSDGSSLIVGNIQGDTTFGDTTLTAPRDWSASGYMAKLNPDGSFAWASKNDGNTVLGRITALNDGSSLITGSFTGTATFGGITLTSTNAFPLFVAKVNADGSYAWATQAEGIYGGGISSITALSDGSSLITGSFTGTATFGGITLITTDYYQPYANSDMYAAKLNPDGSFAWAIRVGGFYNENGKSITAFSDGSSLITGSFRGTVTFGSTTLTSASNTYDDVFVAKLNPDGSFAWANRGGGTNYEKVNSITSFSDGSSLISGFFYNSTNFGSTTLTSTGGADIFVAKLNAGGAWASSWNTTQAVNSGQAVFSIPGTPAAVGNLLTASNTTADPDGNGPFSYSWQTSSNGTTWSPVGTNSSSYTILAADEGKQLQLVVSYTDGLSFNELVTSSGGTIPFFNNGQAVFSISGTPAVGNLLTASNTTADPDNNGTFTYSWQTSSNGTTWSPVGTNSSSYTILAADEGKQLQLVVSYTDAQ